MGRRKSWNAHSIREGVIMQIKGATTILENQCKWLGMEWDKFIAFVDEAPLAQNQKTIEAYKVWKKSNVLRK
jgi:hypothetical protein